MRKSIVLSVATAFLLLAGTPSISSFAQDTSNDQTPTFYRLVPGTYVNGWPRFTITYPKNWVERPPRFLAGEVLAATAPGPAKSPSLGVVIIPFPVP